MNDLVYYRSLAREAWRARRAQMEATRKCYTRAGISKKSKIMWITALVEPTVAVLGLRRRALGNAVALQLNEVEIVIRGLPGAFDGYRILQLADIHAGRLPGLIETAAALVGRIEVDVAVLNGDIQTRGRPSAETAIRHIDPLLAAIRATDGIIGVLGNHDSHDLVEPLERRGVRLLINEHIVLERAGETIRITGVDDVNTFYTDEAERALKASGSAGVSIAIVHSPELADVAADAGYALYLAGHTHGGQICLPGGTPLMTATKYHRRLSAGLWRYGRMAGYTSRGLGVHRRARFNCPPEITVIRLRRDKAG